MEDNKFLEVFIPTDDDFSFAKADSNCLMTWENVEGGVMYYYSPKEDGLTATVQVAKKTINGVSLAMWVYTPQVAKWTLIKGIELCR